MKFLFGYTHVICFGVQPLVFASSLDKGEMAIGVQFS